MNVTRYNSSAAQTDSGPSTGLWGDCKWDDIENGIIPGYTFFENFFQYSATGKFTGTAASGGTLAVSTTDIGGVLKITNDTSANNSASLQSNALGKISSAAPQPLWWEARFKLNIVTKSSLFIGLMDVGTTSANIVTDTTGVPLSTGNFIGFSIAGGTSLVNLDAIYQKASTTLVKQKAIAAVMAADTYVKVGCRYDGTKLYYYVNGLLCETTGVVPSVTAFPDAVVHALVASLKSTTAGAAIMSLDWVRYAQLAA